jgi:hypothetical protein
MPGKASPIRLDVTVLDVWGADVKTETFWTKLRVRAQWECPAEHADEAMRDGGDALDTDWVPEWFPRITVECATERRDEHALFYAQRRGDGCVWVTGEWRIAVQLLEAFDLRAFPFDVQDFNVRLAIENAALGVQLAVLPGASKRGSLDSHHAVPTPPTAPVRVDADALELPDFRMLAERREGSSWFERPALYRAAADADEVRVVLLYQRNPRFYLVNYMLPLGALTSLGAFGWAVPWYQVEDRLALDVALLLTAVASKQALAGGVPPIAYLTRLDAYALLCFAFLLLSTVMHGCLGFLVDSCDVYANCSFHPPRLTQHGAARVDSAFCSAFLALWVLSNCAYAASVARLLRRSRAAFSLANAQAKGFAPAHIAAHEPKWYEEQDTPVARPESRPSAAASHSAGC